MSQQAFQNAWEEIINNLVYQVYYRLLGMVEVLADFDTTVSACQYLAEHVRGGEISTVRTGRVAQWDGLQIAPGLPETPTMSIWIVGLFDRTNQKRSLLLRKGWWTLYLPNYVGAATRIQTFRAPALPTLTSERLFRLTPKVARSASSTVTKEVPSPS